MKKSRQISSCIQAHFESMLPALSARVGFVKATMTPAVSKPGRLVLSALLNHYPTLQSIEEICGTLGGKWSERTVGSVLKALIEDDLALQRYIS